MKLICGCLLAAALLGCLADAQSKWQKLQQNQQHQNKPPANPPQTPNLQRQQSSTSKTLPPRDPEPPKERFHSCEVETQYRIQCGALGVAAKECEAINCCFDGHMCYYGKHVTVQCTKDAQFIVVVARDATLPNIDLESIAFLEGGQNCQPVGITSAFVIYQFPVTECGTVMTEEPGILIYQNTITSSYEVALGPNGAITRDSSFHVVAQCRYIGTTVEALVIEVSLVPPPQPVVAPGPLRVELRLANGQCTGKGCVEVDVAYNSFYTDADYPVRKVLRDPVYVEVQMLDRSDPNLFLTLERCWATTDAYPYSLPQWDLLIDGCPNPDDSYLTRLVPVSASTDITYPSHYRRFFFKMFTFVSKVSADPSKKANAEPLSMTPLQEMVFIHCDTAVCQRSVGNNCEPICLRKKRSIISSAKSNYRNENPVVSSQGIIMTR